MRFTLSFAIALALALTGGLTVLGFIQPFPSTSNCFGLYLLGTCVGYFSASSTGNNFILGVILIGIAGLVYVIGKRKHR